MERLPTPELFRVSGAFKKAVMLWIQAADLYGCLLRVGVNGELTLTFCADIVLDNLLHLCPFLVSYLIPFDFHASPPFSL
ncbi:hypothetical protein ES705_42173 [subsurface metagenome]